MVGSWQDVQTSDIMESGGTSTFKVFRQMLPGSGIRIEDLIRKRGQSWESGIEQRWEGEDGNRLSCGPVSPLDFCQGGTEGRYRRVYFAPAGALQLQEDEYMAWCVGRGGRCH